MNIRRFPETTADRLAAMPKGMVVETIDSRLWNGRWRRIRATFSSNGIVEGYSAAEHLSSVGDAGAPSPPARPDVEPATRPSLPPPGRETILKRAVPASIVAGLFHHTATPNVERFLPLILEALRENGLDDWPHIITALGTINAESARFDPIPEGQSIYNTEEGGAPFAKYDFRNDIGNNAEGDGFKYRGRGFIQLTGKANYERYGKLLDIDLVNEPDRALEPDVAARILALFMKDKKAVIEDAWQAQDWAKARKAVNGGSHGLDNFEKVVKAARHLFDWSKPI